MADQAQLRPWADLPSELLTLIATRSSSDVVGYVSLRCVCTEWRRSLTENSPVPPLVPFLPPQAPFLLAPPTAFPNTSVGKVLPFRFLDDPCLIVDMPQLKNTREQHCICVGSSHGWLINLDEHSNVSLLNPVTSDSIPLEPLSSIREILSFSDPGYFYLKEKREFHDYRSIVHLAALSSDPAICPDFTLLLFLSDVTNRCFTCKGRDHSWKTHYHQPFLNPVEDVVSFNGVFVIFVRESELLIFDFRNCWARLVVRKVTLKNDVPVPAGSVLLVAADGHLLVVYTRFRPIPVYNPDYLWFQCLLYFDQFQVDGVDNNYETLRQPMDKFVLFLNRGSSVAISKLQFPCLSCRRPPMYLPRREETEGGWYWCYVYKNVVNNRVWSSRSFAVDFSLDSRIWIFPKSFWVTPNIRRLNR